MLNFQIKFVKILNCLKSIKKKRMANESFASNIVIENNMF